MTNEWQPALSHFKFADNQWDVNSDYDGKDQYGVIFFGEFTQGAKETGSCDDCKNLLYVLPARHYAWFTYDLYYFEGDVIVT
jgi:hypothetical protein